MSFEHCHFCKPPVRHAGCHSDCPYYAADIAARSAAKEEKRRLTDAKCERYFTPEMDGLKQDWDGVVWCNPPYGRGVGAWVEKAHRTAEESDATVVMLLPARTDTAWFHDYCYNDKYATINFVRGRLKFGGEKNSAPFPSMVVIFRRPAKALH